MSKCKSCGDNYELGPSSISPGVEDADEFCTKCKPKKKKTRRHRVSRRSCSTYPYGVNPCNCGSCDTCRNVVTAKIVFANPDTCDTTCGVDETGLETYQGKKKLPKGPSQCYPFTKDSFARINRTFSFPKVGSIAITEIINVVLADGQPITHEEYGTLIAHPVLGEPDLYELENSELANNGLDVIGKPVPCGKEFYFGYPQCECSVDEIETLECNALLEDFTVPAVDATAEAVVRSYLGIAIDDKVIIRNKVDPNLIYTYRVSGATGDNTLVLENEGDGGTEGAILTAASDVEGEYAWCVEPFTNQSACFQSADTLCMKHILGCDENGNSRKMQGTIENEAPVFDPSCGGFALKVIPKTTTCVLLDSCFQVAPVEDICNHLPITITTTDDAKLIDSATAALLSDNANPLIEICGYVFSLNLLDSEVGALLVTPDFNPEELVSFDKNCKVCIPEDCCFQCNPQVQYPVEAYFPPGKNNAFTVTIPASIITDFGEYKISFVKHPDTQANILFVHDNATNEVTAAYDQGGTPIDLEDLPGDLEDYTYQELTYCRQDSTCPVDAKYEEDINARFYDLVLGEQISLNYHTLFEVFQCNEVGSEGEQLTTTQYGIMGHFVGPSHTSEIAFGDEIFGQVAPEPDGFKTYDAISNYKKRTFALFYPTCVKIRTRPTAILLVEDIWEPISEQWAYASSTTVTVPTGAADRYTSGQKVRFKQTGAVQQTTISTIADTVLTFADAVVANEAIYDKFGQEFPKNKIFQMETTSMLSVNNI